MAANLSCRCGKILTEDNVCPIPSGIPCTGQKYNGIRVRKIFNGMVGGHITENGIFLAAIYIGGCYD